MNLNQEMPSFNAMAYTSQTQDIERLMAQANNLAGAAIGAQDAARRLQVGQINQVLEIQPGKEIINMAATRRIVKVFVADPNENVPVEKCVLIQSDEKLTDLNDRELFFELDIKAALEKHNAYRITVRNKAVKDREEFLEPARIRDLKMTVVTVASF